MLWNRRFRILKKREETHINKLLVQRLSQEQLTQLRIAEFGYQIEDARVLPSDSGKYSLILRKQNGSSGTHLLYRGDSVRVVALEPGIPILACISCTGSIRELNGEQVVVEVYRGNVNQLQSFPILLLRAEVDLTKRELEAIDFIHRSPSRVQNIAYSLLGEHLYEFAA